MYESIPVQELRLEELHHCVNTVQDKIAGVTTISHLVRTSCKAHATVTVHTVCECHLSKNSPRSRKVALRLYKSTDGITCHGPEKGPGEAAARNLPLPVPQLKFLCNVGWTWKLFSHSEKPGATAVPCLLAPMVLGLLCFTWGDAVLAIEGNAPFRCMPLMQFRRINHRRALCLLRYKTAMNTPSFMFLREDISVD